jgi:SAM-dependent methyltransferase
VPRPIDAPPADAALAGAEAGSFGQATDNLAKYGYSGVEGRLLGWFRARLVAAAVRLSPHDVLDAGCGEGVVSGWLGQAIPGAAITGVDGRASAVEAFRSANPGMTAVVGDLTSLPFADGAFDLVVCTEVLEHLPEPALALRELGRVCAGHVLVTVPHEPFFQAGNFVAGRYRDRWGSTPGHLSHWSRRGLLRTVAAELDPVRWFSLFPWQGVLARPAGGPATAS